MDIIKVFQKIKTKNVHEIVYQIHGEEMRYLVLEMGPMGAIITEAFNFGMADRLDFELPLSI